MVVAILHKSFLHRAHGISSTDYSRRGEHLKTL